MGFKKKDKFIKVNLTINLLLAGRLILLLIFLILGLVLSEVPVIGDVIDKISSIYITISLIIISFFAIIELSYWYLLPYIIYWIFVITKLLYNYKNIKKGDLKYIAIMTLCIVFVLVFNVLAITEIKSDEWW